MKQILSCCIGALQATIQAVVNDSNGKAVRLTLPADATVRAAKVARVVKHGLGGRGGRGDGRGSGGGGVMYRGGRGSGRQPYHDSAA